MRLIYRKSAFFLIVSLLSGIGAAKAQFAHPISVELGAGGAILHGDFRNEPANLAGYANIDYMITPFFSAGVNFQAGTLKGSSNFASFENQFLAGNVNLKIRAGQFFAGEKNFGLYSMRNRGVLGYLSYFYVGAGIGGIKNDMTNTINEGYEAPLKVDPDFGTNDPKAMVIPFNLGIDIPFGRTMIGPSWSVNINYQYNLTKSDRVDGYAPAPSKFDDAYSFWTLGVRKALFGK